MGRLEDRWALGMRVERKGGTNHQIRLLVKWQLKSESNIPSQAHETDGLDAVGRSVFVTCVFSRQGRMGDAQATGHQNERDADLRENGICMGHSIQRGSRKMSKSIGMLSASAV